MTITRRRGNSGPRLLHAGKSLWIKLGRTIQCPRKRQFCPHAPLSVSPPCAIINVYSHMQKQIQELAWVETELTRRREVHFCLTGTVSIRPWWLRREREGSALRPYPLITYRVLGKQPLNLDILASCLPFLFFQAPAFACWRHSRPRLSSCHCEGKVRNNYWGVYKPSGLQYMNFPTLKTP